MSRQPIFSSQTGAGSNLTGGAILDMRGLSDAAHSQNLKQGKTRRTCGRRSSYAPQALLLGTGVLPIGAAPGLSFRKRTRNLHTYVHSLTLQLVPPNSTEAVGKMSKPTENKEATTTTLLSPGNMI